MTTRLLLILDNLRMKMLGLRLRVCRLIEAGIDINEHQFASMNADKFNNAAKSNGRNNIGLRWMRRQDSNPAKPNLNKQMLHK